MRLRVLLRGRDRTARSGRAGQLPRIKAGSDDQAARHRLKPLNAVDLLRPRTAGDGVAGDGRRRHVHVGVRAGARHVVGVGVVESSGVDAALLEVADDARVRSRLRPDGERRGRAAGTRAVGAAGQRQPAGRGEDGAAAERVRIAADARRRIDDAERQVGVRVICDADASVHRSLEIGGQLRDGELHGGLDVGLVRSRASGDKTPSDAVQHDVFAGQRVRREGHEAGGVRRVLRNGDRVARRIILTGVLNVESDERAADDDREPGEPRPRSRRYGEADVGLI